jgi:hypothetical protein
MKWADVQALTVEIADRLEAGVNRYAAAYGFAPVRAEDCQIRCECWPPEVLGARADMAALVNPKVLFQDDGNGGNEVDRPPRREDVPPIFVKFGDRLWPCGRPSSGQFVAQEAGGSNCGGFGLWRLSTAIG